MGSLRRGPAYVFVLVNLALGTEALHAAVGLCYDGLVLGRPDAN